MLGVAFLIFTLLGSSCRAPDPGAAEAEGIPAASDAGPSPAAAPAAIAFPLFTAEIIPEKFPAVLVLVAIQAEIFPVGAIRRIILGIAVLVMHRQLMPVFMGKFPAAFGANHAVDL